MLQKQIEKYKTYFSELLKHNYLEDKEVNALFIKFDYELIGDLYFRGGAQYYKYILYNVDVIKDATFGYIAAMDDGKGNYIFGYSSCNIDILQRFTRIYYYYATAVIS